MDKIYEKNTIEFVTVAAEYCGFLEKCNKFSKKDFLLKLHKLLPLIYLKATLLPIEDDEQFFDGESEIFVSEYDYGFVRNNISQKLGKDDNYVNIYNSATNDSGYEQAEISECVADIYQDMKNFTGNFGTGSEQAMAVSLNECIQNFKEYWGYRALSLAAAIHSLVYNFTNDEEEQDFDDDDYFKESDEKKGGNSLINNFLENFHKKI